MIGFILFFGGFLFGYALGKEFGKEEYLAKIQRENSDGRSLEEILKEADRIRSRNKK